MRSSWIRSRGPGYTVFPRHGFRVSSALPSGPSSGLVPALWMVTVVWPHSSSWLTESQFSPPIWRQLPVPTDGPLWPWWAPVYQKCLASPSGELHPNGGRDKCHVTTPCGDVMASFSFRPCETSHANSHSHKLLAILLKPTKGKHVYPVFKPLT